MLDWHDGCHRRGPDGSYFAPLDQVWKNIAEIRDLVDTEYRMLGVKEYHISEWGRAIEQTGVGTEIAFFHYLDLAGVDRAARALWTANDLCGLLVSPKTPRTTYWAWKAYADGVGMRLLTETNDRSTVAIASRDDAQATVRIVVGRAKRYTLENKPMNLPPVRTRIDCEGVPIEGSAEVSMLRLGPGVGALWEDNLPGLTQKQVLAVDGGKLRLILDALKENEARAITIAPLGTWERERAAKEARVAAEPETAEKDEQELHREATAKAAAAAEAGMVRICCGAPLAFIDSAGNAWFADREYEDGKFGHAGGGTVQRVAIAIAGTDNPEIYRTELWGQDSYRISVPNGRYALRMHWAETYGANRKFDVTVEGHTVLKDFNPLEEAGGTNRAIFREFSAQVDDGVLDILFPHEGAPPMINAIEVIRK